MILPFFAVAGIGAAILKVKYRVGLLGMQSIFVVLICNSLVATLWRVR